VSFFAAFLFDDIGWKKEETFEKRKERERLKGATTQ